MPNYHYKAYDRQGRAMKGEMVAESSRAVSTALTAQGYIPVTVSPMKSAPSFFEQWFSPSVKLTELNVFTRQLWTLLKAGLPLQTSLISLRDQARNETLKKVIVEIITDLEAGSSLSNALLRHPRIFQPVYVGMIKVGEVSGRLDDVLYQLAEIGQFEAETREKIKAATRYPILALASIIMAFILVVTFVIPKFSSLFGQFKAKLPFPTRILLGLNDLVRHDWLLLLLALGATLFAFRYWVDTPRGRYHWDWFKLKVPVFGPLTFNLMMSRFAKILSILLTSGIPILQALQIVSDTIGNVVLQKAVLAIQQSVNEGKRMSDPMKHSGLFSPMVVQMVAVGEQTGKTDELLNHVAGYYEEQANFMIKNMTTLIEPLLIMILGGMVLMLALGVFLPMWDLTNVVQ